jgi:hypothetical protein
VVGITRYLPSRIYIRDCRGVLRRKRFAVDTLGHEILHVLHPAWSERRVVDNEHSEGAFVLRFLRLYS